MRPAALLPLLALLVAGCSDDDGLPTAGTATPTTTAPTTTSAALDPVDGEPGLGDPYFPGQGGTGFQVERYELDLDITGDGVRLDGTATLHAEATVDLASFTLDLIGLDVASATVDGDDARFERDGRELRIHPPEPLPAGDPFTVVVAYGGAPRPVDSPSLGPTGWLTYPGGSYVIGEPEGAAGWFPANDHPSDKATFRFELTVPPGVEAVANGVLVDRTDTTWTWESDDPMATYLAQVAVGQFTLTEEEGPGGVTIRNAFADAIADEMVAAFARQPEMLAFYVERFGPYPFDAYGALVVDTPLGLALETQTLSIFGQGATVDPFIAHELAHQWFGNSVTPERWQDIWLNEGFATYAEWLWAEHAGGRPVAQQAAASHEGLSGGVGDLPPGDPGPELLFHPSVYHRGALTLYALEVEIGDGDLTEVLRRWAAERGGANGTTEDFVALAEEVSGEQLDDLFDQWLHAEELPPLPTG